MSSDYPSRSGSVTAESIGALTASDISNAAPQALGVAAAGATGDVSDAGHVHPTTGLVVTGDLSSATPGAVDVTGSAGVASTVSRSDHVHAAPWFATVTTEGRQTLDGASTVVTLAQYTVPTDHRVTVEFTGIGWRGSDSSLGHHTIRTSSWKNIGGTLSQIGTADAEVNDTDSYTVVWSEDVSGTTLRCRAMHASVAGFAHGHLRIKSLVSLV